MMNRMGQRMGWKRLESTGIHWKGLYKSYFVGGDKDVPIKISHKNLINNEEENTNHRN